MTTTAINFRMDKELKADFEKISEALGLTPSALFNVFAKKVVANRGLPFPLTIDRPLSLGEEKILLHEENIRLGAIPDDSTLLTADDFKNARKNYQ